MRRQFAVGGARANVANENAGVRSTQHGYIAEIIRNVFRQDVVKTLAQITGLSLGAAGKKAYAQREFTADELAKMLRTEKGFELLTAIMADAQPKWWRLVSASMDIREAQRFQAEARTRIRRAVRGALDADADLTAAIARAEAFSDEDFHRPHADALRTMGGVSHRALDKTTKAKR